MLRKLFFISLLFLTSSSFMELEADELYLNYAAAIKHSSTVQYYLVVKIKNLNTGQLREICTEGNFLQGAIMREYHLGYDKEGISKCKKIALENKERYFEFGNDSALSNLGLDYYSTDDLRKLEKEGNFDSLADYIKKFRGWEKAISDDKIMAIWAHALFNRGIMTAENSCFGGRLFYVNRNGKQKETYLIPDDFNGEFRVVYGEKCGLYPQFENGRRLLQIPRNGVLIIQPHDEGGTIDEEFYLVDKNGSRKKINSFIGDSHRTLNSAIVVEGRSERLKEYSDDPQTIIGFCNYQLFNRDTTLRNQEEESKFRQYFDSLTIALVEVCRDKK